MKVSRLYVISVESNGKSNISQEAYWSYSEAENFIKSRSDKPEKKSPYLFESDKYTYKINDVFAHGGR